MSDKIPSFPFITSLKWSMINSFSTIHSLILNSAMLKQEVFQLDLAMELEDMGYEAERLSSLLVAVDAAIYAL